MGWICPVLLDTGFFQTPTWGNDPLTYGIYKRTSIGTTDYANASNIYSSRVMQLGTSTPRILIYNRTGGYQVIDYPSIRTKNNQIFQGEIQPIKYSVGVSTYVSFSTSECVFVQTTSGANPDYRGGSPPPPRRRNKECGCMSCDCNDIATMFARQFAEYNRQIEDLKDFIQKTAVEEVKIHQKQLEAITIDLDLQPVVNRINEVESNLWNGIKK